MSGPWQNYGPSPAGTGPWQNYGSPPEPDSGSGAVLPFSWDKSGVRFDPSAGIMGTVGRAATLPGDVYSGKTNPLSNEGIGRVTDLATLATPGGAGAAWFRKTKVPLPSSAELKTEGGAGRNLARSMGVVYSTDAVVGLAGKTQADLLQAGLGPKVAEKTNALLADLQKVPNDPSAQADFSTTIEAARNNLQSIAQGADAQDGNAASRAISALDEFIKRPPPGSVVAGPASALGEVFTDANSNYAAGSRAQTIEGLGTRATNQASASNSGLNLDNSVRNRVARFINPGPTGGASLAKQSGFTESEIALLQNIVDGKATTNTLRWLGNVLGGGGGMGAVVTGGVGGIAGASVGNPVGGAMLGLALPAAGLSAKMAENAATKRALANAGDQLRSRSALYADRQAATPDKAVNPVQRAQIIRTLLLGTQPLPAALPPYQAPTQLRSTTGQPIPAGTTIY